MSSFLRYFRGVNLHFQSLLRMYFFVLTTVFDVNRGAENSWDEE